ncbi:EamA family transporter [Microbacterium sp. JZ31]|uniref:EamA family transporter n=1 Tax=Microbacterium sp. JZ31 TaxID=1906274 RepID=UPI001933BFDE|nr:EamA family transporter [Microbacterium sp. JZ31]
MTAILLALASAAAYGVSDFFGGLFSKRHSAWTIAFWGQLGALLTAGLLALWVGGRPQPPDFLWAGVAGVGSALGTAFLYRGLAGGRMSVVAPISAVVSAAVPIVVGVATGERPAALTWVGIAVGLVAIWLVARAPDPAGGTREGAAASVRDGVIAGAGFGAYFAAIGQVREEAGLWPNAASMVVAALVLLGVLLAVRAPLRLPPRRAGLALLPGVLGAVALTLFLLASQAGLLTVVAVIASLYPAATVILAAAVLHERIHRGQAVGLAACAAAVALVAVG